MSRLCQRMTIKNRAALSQLFGPCRDTADTFLLLTYTSETEERVPCAKSHSKAIAELAGDKPQGFSSPWPASIVHSLAQSSSANPTFITIQ